MFDVFIYECFPCTCKQPSPNHHILPYPGKIEGLVQCAQVRQSPTATQPILVERTLNWTFPLPDRTLSLFLRSYLPPVSLQRTG